MNDFMKRFNDPAQWKLVRDVKIFDEHEERQIGPDGREQVERFSVPELEEIARNCNQLVEAGSPPGITFGHTTESPSEREQPITIGYGRSFRVRYDATLRRHVIAYDEQFYPQHFELAKTCPYRSVERHRAQRFFSPVAAIRRTPRLQLGIVTYRAKNDTVVRYSMAQEHPMSSKVSTVVGIINETPAERQRLDAVADYVVRRTGMPLDQARATCRLAKEQGCDVGELVRYAAAPPGQWMDASGQPVTGRPGAPEPPVRSQQQQQFDQIAAMRQRNPGIDEQTLYAAMGDAERDGVSLDDAMKARMAKQCYTKRS